MSKKFKMPSSYSILFLIIIAVAVGTWFIPAGQYEVTDNGQYVAGTYRQVESSRQGAWEVFMSPVRGMLGTDSTSGAIEVSFFIMIFGGFLGVVTRTGAIDAGIASMIMNSGGKEKRLIPILMVIFALGGTSYGMSEETIAFYPLLVPMMLSAGFDTITAVAVILLGAGVGCLGSTINPFATGIASQSAGISPGVGIGWRALIFVVSLSIAIVYVYRYASRIQSDRNSSVVADVWDDDVKFFSKSKKDVSAVTPVQRRVLWLFGITFVIMVSSLIPWTAINENFTIFESATNALLQVPILGDLLGRGMVPFGDWYFQEITMLFLIMSIVIGKVGGMKEYDIADAIVEGAKDLVGVAFVVGLARGIQVIMNDGQLTATVLHWGEVGLAGLPRPVFAVLSFLFYIPMTFLIPSTSGLASATIPIMAPLSVLCGVPAHVMVTIYQSAAGIVNLATPTYAVVMGALALGHVSYDRWLRFVSKLLVILLIVNLVIVAVMSIAG
ncbi:MAG: YfcC family protein [Synergistaceae bacterium]|jgi:uncharacterized ion transporter superfamily protein YfcC|nr:YfcC family protein [Synergistaceae bacterium]